MHDDGVGSVAVQSEESPVESVSKDEEVVSTHVLVPAYLVERLRELSRKTRIHQSEYLREAVDDLLVKYGALGKESA